MSLTLLFAGPGVITGGVPVGDYRYYWINGIIYRKTVTSYRYYWNGAFWYRKL